jgi:hypothetical protein
MMILLADRRTALMHLCLGGMDMAWFAPLMSVLWPGELRLRVAFGLLWGSLIIVFLLLDLLRLAGLRPPLYHIAVVLLLAVSFLAATRLFLYPPSSALHWTWVETTLAHLNPFRAAGTSELIVLVTCLYIWQRAAWATSRSLDMFDLGLTFRVELSLLLISGSFYGYLSESNDGVMLVWIFLALGATVLAWSRSREVPLGVHRPPPRIPACLLGFTVGAVGITTILGIGLWRLAPSPIRALLRWTAPIWEILVILLQIVLLFSTMVTVDIVRFLRGLVQNTPPPEAKGFEMLAQLARQLIQTLWGSGTPATIPAWLIVSAEILIVTLALGLLMGLVLFFLRFFHRPNPTEEPIVQERLPLPKTRQLLLQTASQIKSWAHLVRRYGLSRHLLAAISVQNIYANLCRLARRRGHPRHPAHPPDVYLAELIETFQGCTTELTRITETYMWVHYGDRVVSPQHLSQIKMDYEAIKKQTTSGRTHVT